MNDEEMTNEERRELAGNIDLPKYPVDSDSVTAPQIPVVVKPNQIG